MWKGCVQWKGRKEKRSVLLVTGGEVERKREDGTKVNGRRMVKVQKAGFRDNEEDDTVITC